MTTIPQLRKDINDLQDQVRRLKIEVEIERSKPPVVKEVVREIPKQVVKVVEKEVPGPEIVVFRDVERVVYRDNPKHIAMIRKLQGKA